MASHILSQFPQDEQDDFAAVCQKYGRTVSEFEVVDEDQYPSGGRVGSIGRQVPLIGKIGKDTMARPVQLRYKNTEIDALVPTGNGSGEDYMALAVRSLREALGDSGALKVGVVALRDHCYMRHLRDASKEVIVMTREAVVVLLHWLATDEAKAFHAWLDAELPAPPVEPVVETKAGLSLALRSMRAWTGRTLH